MHQGMIKSMDDGDSSSFIFSYFTATFDCLKILSFYKWRGNEEEEYIMVNTDPRGYSK